MYYIDKMIDRIKDQKSGKFVQKSDEKRKVRSMRLTDSTWNYLKDKSEENDITIADLIEQIVDKKLLEVESNNLDKKELHKIRDESLKSLNYGTQSKCYKECKKAFNQFINHVLRGG